MTAKEAIKILEVAKAECEWNAPLDYQEAFDLAIEALRNSQTQMSETSDMISRQQAVDTICKEWCNCHHDDCENKTMIENGFDPCDGCSDVDAIMDLPSAQPEIIHCGDCRYKDDGIDEDGIPFLKCLNGRSYGGTRINDFCSWAERRTE